jgi:NADPH:quinone reductase-like Zn-dependent oxidoreductase
VGAGRVPADRLADRVSDVVRAQRSSARQTVLVQGASGGVATGAIALGHAAGLRVWATGRDEAKRDLAMQLGADRTFEPGVRLPERVDAVIETVGEVMWGHSVRALKPGGTIVIAGATTGHAPPAELQRIFFLQHRVIGSTMGTKTELEQLVSMCALTGVRPLVDRELALVEAHEALAQFERGEARGKVVLTNGA